jgi:hypothetical protein
MAELARLASEIKTSQGLDIVVGPGYYGITIIRSGYVSVAVGWQQPFANYVGDSDPQESHLWVAEYSGTLSLQGEPPRVAGKTIGLDGDRLRRISAAPLESGRILRPVLVSLASPCTEEGRLPPTAKRVLRWSANLLGLESERLRLPGAIYPLTQPS